MGTFVIQVFDKLSKTRVVVFQSEVKQFLADTGDLIAPHFLKITIA